MKKLIIEFKVGKLMQPFIKRFLDNMESFELLELLKLDFKKGTKLVIGSVKMKPGVPLKALEMPNVSILNVLQQDGDEYVCLFKGEVPAPLKVLMKKFDLDLVWTAPMTLDKEKVVYSVIGEEKELRKLLNNLNLIGEAKVVSFQNATYDSHGMLNTLTEQQRKTVIEAKKRGYYEYPRKINAEGLARKLNLSKATVVEHLRKAEIRLIANILSGY